MEGFSKLQIRSVKPEEVGMDDLKALVGNKAFRLLFYTGTELLQNYINGISTEKETDNIFRDQGAIAVLNEILSFVPRLEEELLEKEGE